jgi:orotidine-5'-phosphate decarboxylase
MSEVIVALDTPSKASALELVERLGSAADFYKVGLELFTAEGPTVVRELLARDKRVFLDLKLHDIPNTVGGAVRAASALGVHMLTLHATGGAAMLETARAAVTGRLRLVAVTALTSLDAPELGRAWGRRIGSVHEEASRLAALAKAAGLHGVVASAADAARIRPEVGEDFLLVVPGIRLGGAARDDQRRVGTPAGAVKAGADYLVIGRAVTRADDPAAALAAVLEEIDRARAVRS